MIAPENEEKYKTYLNYLYETASIKYTDCSDIDALVQESLLAFLIKSETESIEHPYGYLSAILKNKYYDQLRGKYREEPIPFDNEDIADENGSDTTDGEYEAVRREIGRLIKIYREVTVRHYVHGQSVEQISKELDIPKGTVLSRLSKAREQIKDGIENMERYADISYEPKQVQLGIWGGAGYNHEPFSLLSSPIEQNALILAYENPVSVRGISDTMGMPCAYLEPIIEKLVNGELMGKTASGLVYTRCFMQRYEDSFGDIPAQEALAEQYALNIWQTVSKHASGLTALSLFSEMSEKQKATLMLFITMQALSQAVIKAKPKLENEIENPPKRKNGGYWLATGTILEAWQKRDNKYESSGPCRVSYGDEKNGIMCEMVDFHSLFGGAHNAYIFEYTVGLQQILRFYASLCPCEVGIDSGCFKKLLPDFERLHIIKRNKKGEPALDIPALPFEETREYVDKTIREAGNELFDRLGNELEKLYLNNKIRVPKHVDHRECFFHGQFLNVFVKAALVQIVEQKILPYKAVIGETPIIFVSYKRKDV